jgi:hypothetical protein
MARLLKSFELPGGRVMKKTELAKKEEEAEERLNAGLYEMLKEYREEVVLHEQTDKISKNKGGRKRRKPRHL